VEQDVVPRLLAQAWGVAVAPQRGPKRELTHEGIVDAAMALADTEGLEAVTMSRVAKSFGFTTMALYRYVTSKDDLHQLMADAVLAQADWLVDEAEWREALPAWAAIMQHAYAEHPWALQIPATPESHLMPGRMRAADAGLRALRSLDADAGAKDAVLRMVSAVVRGLVLVTPAATANRSVTGETVELLKDVVADAHLVDVEPLLQDVLLPVSDDPAASDHMGATLQAALTLIIAGLGQRHGDGEATPPHRDREPQEEWELAEAELTRLTALRKRAQRTLKDLEKREAKARTARDKAKVAAKEAAKEAAKASKKA
jgi:AcrR family transcriptional regulator